MRSRWPRRLQGITHKIYLQRKNYYQNLPEIWVDFFIMKLTLNSLSLPAESPMVDNLPETFKIEH